MEKIKKYTVIQETDDYTVSYLNDDTGDEIPLLEDIDSQYVYILEPDEEDIVSMDQIKEKFRFLKDSLNIGKISQGDKVVLEYPFEGDSSVIERVKPSCGCTAKVEIDADKKVIRATYDSKGDKGGISKSISVFFKDNIPLEIKNALGAIIDNPKKLKVNLKFNGTVQTVIKVKK